MCDDAFSDLSARVACRALGLPFGGARAHGSAYFGPGNGPILLDQVRVMRAARLVVVVVVCACGGRQAHRAQRRRWTEQITSFQPCSLSCSPSRCAHRSRAWATRLGWMTAPGTHGGSTTAATLRTSAWPALMLRRRRLPSGWQMGTPPPTQCGAGSRSSCAASGGLCGEWGAHRPASWCRRWSANSADTCTCGVGPTQH